MVFIMFTCPRYKHPYGSCRDRVRGWKEQVCNPTNGESVMVLEWETEDGHSYKRRRESRGKGHSSCDEVPSCKTVLASIVG